MLIKLTAPPIVCGPCDTTAGPLSTSTECILPVVGKYYADEEV